MPFGLEGSTPSLGTMFVGRDSFRTMLLGKDSFRTMFPPIIKTIPVGFEGRLAGKIPVHQTKIIYRQIKTAMIAVSIIAVKLSDYARRMILLGSLSYEPRGNLSLFTVTNYIALTLLAQELSTLERLITGLATDKKAQKCVRFVRSFLA
jgi:hypothetical protein